ncbi:MAG TPA: class I SAM-dependent methyltransferase [Thermoanaerobaculia bacterium]|jgi:SAM-dependent methyltransferase|nr:class I SAM-dependent methyltransferase [Thermoanaerobaculia bacterium]
MASRAESYDAFAYAYDKALGARFFKAVRRLLSDSLEKYPPRGPRTHLDVACGTGLAVDFFRGQGWSSLGVDASLPMLQMARVRAPRVVAGDYRALPFRGTFARITCLYDSLNHLKDRTELAAAFRSMRRLMGPDSLLLFDMNHPDIYPAVWGMREPYVAGGADYHLEIATTWRKREGIGHALVTGWAVLPGGAKVEIHERHEQRSYREREIVESLTDAGLAPVEVLDFDPYDEAGNVDAEGVKLFFICRAKS